MPKLIPSLNGLRGLSILFVLIAHIQIMSFHLPDGPGGQIGVNIFFVISGFLITYLLLKEEAATGTISLKNFFIRRSLRIFPVFYFMLLVYAVLQLLGVLHIGIGSWLSSITYTKYFFMEGAGDWETGHVWSLSVEEHFYLLWPFIFVYLPRFRQVFAIAVIVAVPLLRLFTDVSVMHLFTRADALMWGCLFALHHKRIFERTASIPRLVRTLPFLGLLFCLLSKKLLVFPGMDPAFHDHFILSLFGSFGMLTNIFIGFIVIISISSNNNLYFVFLNSGPMNFIGKLSYSIYLWQQLFFSKNIGIFASFPLNLLCLLLVATASYYWIEKPFFRWKDRLQFKLVPKVTHASGPSIPEQAAISLKPL